MGGQNAIQIFADGANAQILNLIISGTNNDGILVQGDGVFIDGVSITGDSLTSNDGIDTSAAVTNLTIEDTNVNDTEQEGIRLRANIATLTRVTINNAGDRGIQIDATADNVTITDLDINNPADHCITSDGDNLTVNGTNTLDDCGGRGFDLNIDGGLGSGTVDISNITVTNATLEGAFFRNIANGTIDNVSVSTAAAVNDAGIEIRDISTANIVVSNLTASGPYIYGIRVRNGDDAIYNGINAISGATIAGLYLSNGANQNIFSDYTISSNSIGILIDGPDTNDFTAFIIENNTDDGVQFINTSNNHEFFNTIIRNNGGDGVDIQVGINNAFLSGTQIHGNTGVGVRVSGTSTATIRDSQIYSNTGSGLDISSTGVGNTIEANLFLENGSPGINLSGTGTTTFFENCLRNVTNISDLTGTTTYVNVVPDPDMGNFWGSIPAGTGFSETCTDASSTTTVQTLSLIHI